MREAGRSSPDVFVVVHFRIRSKPRHFNEDSADLALMLVIGCGGAALDDSIGLLGRPSVRRDDPLEPPRAQRRGEVGRTAGQDAGKVTELHRVWGPKHQHRRACW